MEKFTRLSGIAAPLEIDNVDTDMIIPARFLRTIKRTGLGANLFNDLRFDGAGGRQASFILNQEAYRQARILVAGRNFGCGSSREHAAWALSDFGIRCIIAPQFADIFFANCGKNGILLIKLPEEICKMLSRKLNAASEAMMTVDLPTQKIILHGGREIEFDIDPERKTMLEAGADDIALTLRHEPSIDRYEANDRTARPWHQEISI